MTICGATTTLTLRRGAGSNGCRMDAVIRDLLKAKFAPPFARIGGYDPVA